MDGADLALAQAQQDTQVSSSILATSGVAVPHMPPQNEVVVSRHHHRQIC
jgi:hypothetical protein